MNDPGTHYVDILLMLEIDSTNYRPTPFLTSFA